FKVLFVRCRLNSNLYRISFPVVFVNRFFISLQTFSSILNVFFRRNPAAVFSGELYHIKAEDKCQQLFYIFITKTSFNDLTVIFTNLLIKKRPVYYTFAMFCRYKNRSVFKFR
ncbi:hypothetical protein AALB39_24465, partial [Lachnospiraceae bacterium 54-53]